MKKAGRGCHTVSVTAPSFIIVIIENRSGEEHSGSGYFNPSADFQENPVP
jgi:hypothetical protein